MGQFLNISPAQIQPSQDFLKEDTLRHILELINNGDENDLPPSPIVREGIGDGMYVAIDGHNLIAVYDYLGQHCHVYVANAADDSLPLTDDNRDAILKRNRDLTEKFETSLEEAIQLKAAGISSFAQLRRSYPIVAAASKQAKK